MTKPRETRYQLEQALKNIIGYQNRLRLAQIPDNSEMAQLAEILRRTTQDKLDDTSKINPDILRKVLESLNTPRSL